MIFKLHYWFMAAGANALSILLGVFFATYTDATQTEIGFLYMLMPFSSMIFRPIICSFADRKCAHQRYLIKLLIIAALSYLPFVVIPLIGPQLYEQYPRACWYILLIFKIAGDIAFGGASSIGDSLAINYAHRVGTEFAVYRVWATISWMVFGALVGQVNEVWFLPKYVPAFMILIGASLINTFIIWLWPREYFVMMPLNQTLKKQPQSKAEKEEEEKKRVVATSKVLMPRAVVWAHAKRKLVALATCSWSTLKEIDKQQVTLTTMANQQKNIVQGAVVGAENQKTQASENKGSDIDRSTQMKLLMMLLRRDPRILLYALMLIAAGFTVVPLSFFIMSLSELCHGTHACDYSQLVGFLQVSMAIAETILFIYIKRIIQTIGRLNTATIAFALATIKYTFYASPLWANANPYFALVSEIPHGIIFGTFLTLMVELAHFFSNEVEFLIPELVKQGIVRADDQASCDKLKMSLAATMQALMTSSNDGIGRGVGALIYGILLDHYPYNTLWMIVAVGSGCVCSIIIIINILDISFGFKLGLD